MKNKKASISFYITLIMFSIIIVLIASVFAPLGANIGTEFYVAGEKILNMTQDNLASISDATIRDEINQSIVLAQQSQQLNIQTNTDLYRYGWLLLIGVIGLGIFLFSRKINEVRGLS